MQRKWWSTTKSKQYLTNRVYNFPLYHKACYKQKFIGRQNFRGFIKSSEVYFCQWMPCLHSLRSWAMHFTFTRLRLAGKMIISPRLRLGQIIFIGALINCLSLNNPLITTKFLKPLNLFWEHGTKIFKYFYALPCVWSLDTLFYVQTGWTGSGLSTKICQNFRYFWNITSITCAFHD